MAILYLELTGLPIARPPIDDANNRTMFPWPKPDFIPLNGNGNDTDNNWTRQCVDSTDDEVITFKVPIFESEHLHRGYIFPESLFCWRLRTIENAMVDSAGDISQIQFVRYVPDIIDVVDNTNKDSNNKGESSKGDDDFGGREWEEGGMMEGIRLVPKTCMGSEATTTMMIDTAPWELTLLNQVDDVPLPTKLESKQSMAILTVLNTANSIDMEPARNHLPFSKVVLPIDLFVICRRLKYNYYTNIGGVITDLGLIRSNTLGFHGLDSIEGPEAHRLHIDILHMLQKYMGDVLEATTTTNKVASRIVEVDSNANKIGVNPEIDTELVATVKVKKIVVIPRLKETFEQILPKKMIVDTLNENDLAVRKECRYNYDDECLSSPITHFLENLLSDTFSNEQVAPIINLQNANHKGLSSELVYPGPRGPGLIENIRRVENTSMNQI